MVSYSYYGHFSHENIIIIMDLAVSRNSIFSDWIISCSHYYVSCTDFERTNNSCISDRDNRCMLMLRFSVFY